MNPRYVSRESVTKPKPEALFAAEVYRDEDEPETRDAASDEIAQLRTELRGEARALRLALSRPAKVPAELLAELASLRAEVSELLAAPKRGDAVATAIRARGIEGAAAATLARLAKDGDKPRARDKAPSSSKGASSTNGKLRAACASLVRVAPSPQALANEGRTLIALVGPAGVGKTTTAAKLAAHARMAKKTVALVSCDAFRVGAMDQLGKYAELMDARFHTAVSGAELADIVRNEDADVIIVDTSGRAVEPDATEAELGAPELRNAERLGRHVEVLLCVPASLRAADAARVHRDFVATRPTSLAVTKLDETDAPAGIAHAAFATRLPVSTLTTGQRVPEDIAEASDAAIADYLFPSAPEAKTSR
ncbi:MAG: AAA family ATPase [Labilithrix sp.]|nr:AAA family ATPase [Labilithrix sp.]